MKTPRRVNESKCWNYLHSLLPLDVLIYCCCARKFINQHKGVSMMPKTKIQSQNGNQNENKSVSGAASLLPRGKKTLKCSERKKLPIQIKPKLIAGWRKIDLNKTSFCFEMLLANWKYISRMPHVGRVCRWLATPLCPLSWWCNCSCNCNWRWAPIWNWLAVQFIYCEAKRHEIAKLYSAVNLNSEQLNVKFISDSCSLITFQSNVEFWIIMSLGNL